MVAVVVADEAGGDKLAVVAGTVNDEAAEISSHLFTSQGTSLSPRESWRYPAARRRTEQRGYIMA